MRIFLSFDFDADSAEQLYYSDKPVKISRAKFSVNIGLDRVLRLLRKYSIKTTFFVPGWVAENYQNHVIKIINDGHEIALHGYKHEKLDELSYDEEVRIHSKSIEILKRFQSDLYGFRRPYWELSKHTLRILVAKGIIYDSSLMDHEEPYLLKINGQKIVELPVYDTFDDWILFELEYRSPLEVLNDWKYWLDTLIEEKVNYFCLILHPACIGRTPRLKILEDFIQYALRKGCTFKKGVQLAKETLRNIKE